MVFGHVGHILIDAPLFLAPVILLGGGLWISARRYKREGRDSD